MLVAGAAFGRHAKVAIAERLEASQYRPMWIAVTIIAVVGLLLFGSDKQNPVRASLTLGILAGLLAAGVYFFLGYDFQWAIAGKWIVAIVAISSAQEAFRWVRKRMRR